jgi:polycomb group RING finger protein 3
VAYFNTSKRDCPHCGVRLGQQPQFRYDRTLQCLVDKIFPEFEEDEQSKEEPFYAERGIKRKAEAIAQQTAARVSAENAASARPVPRPMAADNAEETSFKLEPAPNTTFGTFGNMTELPKPFLRTSGQLRVMHLKKYLCKKLNLAKPEEVDILCKGDILGGELSLDFIKKTRWYDSTDLVLHYCPPVSVQSTM